MWKCASKSLIASFNKGLVKDGGAVLNGIVISKQKRRQSLLNFTPVLLAYFNRYYGFYKNSCGKYSQEKKNKENPNGKGTSFLRGFNHNVFDALTWGGVFVLGFYFLQPFKKSKWKSNVNGYDCRNCSISSGYQATVNYLIESFGLRPVNYVLPQVKAAKNSHGRNKSLESCSTDKSNASELERAHQKVSGVLSNWIGIQYMESGNHKEALEFFIESANENNAAGIFNLGICHEKGLGTNQNFKRAAELYQRATDLGHPSAMYNLGVFYAQGLGGVEVDIDRARELFRGAARLGQKDAERALNLENEDKSSMPIKDTSVTESISCLWLGERVRDTTTSLIENFKVIHNEKKAENYDFCDNDSGVLDLSPHNDVDGFEP